MIYPWTEPPLAVVGGGTVLPAAAAFLKIGIGPITEVVEAAILDNNVLPFITREGWLQAAHSRLIFKLYGPSSSSTQPQVQPS